MPTPPTGPETPSSRDAQLNNLSFNGGFIFLIADDKKEKTSSAGDKTAKPGGASKPPGTPTKPPKSNPAPSAPVGVNLEKVDLGKISSILSSLTSAMKNTGRTRRSVVLGVCVVSMETAERVFVSAASPAQPPTGATTSAGQAASAKAAPSSPALASILSRVDITPEGILNALSKANTPGEPHTRRSLTFGTRCRRIQ